MSEDTPVNEVKRLIHERFASAGIPAPDNMRLRERAGLKLTNVLLDTKTLKDAYKQRLVDGRELVVQPTEEAEWFTERDLLLILRVR